MIWRPGAVPTPDGVAFAVAAPGADAVELVLERAGGTEVHWLQAQPDVTGPTLFAGEVPGARAGDGYGFRVHGPWDPAAGIRYNPAKLLVDPYARAVTGALALDDRVMAHVPGDPLHRDDRDSAPVVPRSVVAVDPAPLTWDDPLRPHTAWSDTVIAEVHVKGYTAAHPDVPPPLRGTYAGLAHPAVLEHLTGLGVTAVELMPVQHFVTEPRLAGLGLTNYWGYNPLAWFAPHAAYSASGSRGQQVAEFRAMTDAMHAAGLQVLSDVVFNHTAEQGGDGPMLSLRGLGDSAHYRTAGIDYVDFTGCGNTIAAHRPATLSLILDALRHWVLTLGVDGFRFDLAAALARDDDGPDDRGTFLTAVAADPVLSQVVLIAEPWDLGEGGYVAGRFPAPWSEWNDRYRDGVRDFWRGRSAGVADVATRVSGSADRFEGRGAAATVNYITAHDGFTVADLVSYADKHNEANGERNRDGRSDNRSENYGTEGPTDDARINAVRRRQMRNLLGTLLLSHGTPMLNGGDEFGRSQQGNNNAYCQDNALSWLDWDLDPWQHDLTSWVRAFTALRRDYPVLRPTAHVHADPLPDGRTRLAWFGPDGPMDPDSFADPGRRCLALYFASDQPQGSLLIAFNSGVTGSFTLPAEPWARRYRLLLDTRTDRPTAAAAPTDAGTVVTVGERSLLVWAADLG